jgi:cytochrome oxidase assembly protein ShyY1
VNRSLFRGRYLVGHLVVLILAGLFILAGFWQLDRLHQVRQRNAVVRSRMQSAPVSLGEVLPANAAAPGSASYRRVIASGTYDSAHQILIQFRSYSGDPGFYLMAPLVVGGRDAILVNRGWVPLSNPPLPPGSATAPPGDVRVTGILFPPEKGGSAPTVISGGPVEATRINIALLRSKVPYRLYPAYVQLTAQDPKQAGDYPITLPLPSLDEGPHLSYAIQWFLFTAIGLIGWPLLIRRSRNERAS